ncbi:MAG: ribosomal small subunit methyltransferase b [Pseudomonadota bacterium]
MQAVLNEYVQKTPPGLTLYLLWAAISLVPEKNREPMYPMHTLVNEAVNASNLDPNLGYAKGLINAVLRRVLRNENIYQEISEEKNPSYPDWWIRKLKYAYPEQAEAIISFSRAKPPLTLRLNQKQIIGAESKQAYMAQFSEAGLECQDLASIGNYNLSSGFELTTPVPVAQIPGFFDGACSVQDAGAQLAGQILNPAKGARVLDACAAPGGKSAQLLEQFDIALDALEIDPLRAKRIEENFSRLKLTGGQVLIGDAANPNAWFKGELYDAILADVPCSASGIVRRHPDIPYLRQEIDIKNLQVTQRKILTALWSVLKPGGKLLYVTCSVFPDEGELQAKWWLSAMPNALRLEAPGQLLPNKQHDGFFYALFEKAKD